VSHDTLGKYLGLSRSAVSRLLNDEGSGIGLPHLEKCCEFFQITPAEFMVDPGALIQPIQPLEAQLLGIFREMTELEKRGLLDVLDRNPRPVAANRRKRERFGQPRLSEREQHLIDLFVRSGPQVQEGVLRMLKGTAQPHHAPAADGDRSE
jgi:transcriptional regulator with XRE-family HTH domain